MRKRHTFKKKKTNERSLTGLPCDDVTAARRIWKNASGHVMGLSKTSAHNCTSADGRCHQLRIWQTSHLMSLRTVWQCVTWVCRCWYKSIEMLHIDFVRHCVTSGDEDYSPLYTHTEIQICLRCVRIFSFFNFLRLFWSILAPNFLN